MTIVRRFRTICHNLNRLTEVLRIVNKRAKPFRPIVSVFGKTRNDFGHQTTTRFTLDSTYQASQKDLDWMSVPWMPEYVNDLVSGKTLNDHGHWAEYARDRYIIPLKEARGGEINMVSLACGSGHIEASLITQFGWPLTKFLGLEYDDELRATVSGRFGKISTCQSDFGYFDFNSPDYPDHQFDIVFACHSLHHATGIDLLLEKINQMLRSDGLFIGIDYFGPTRFQIEFDVIAYCFDSGRMSS